jgi:integrase
VATVYKRGRFWWARWYRVNGERVSQSTREESKREAKRIAAEMEAKDRRESLVDRKITAKFEKVLKRAAEDATAGTLTLERAKSYLAELVQSANPKFGGVSVGDFLQSWNDAQAPRVSPHTYAVCEQMRKRFTAEFGPKLCAEGINMLTAVHIEKALHAIAKTVKACTANVWFSSLKRALREAARQRLIAENPADAVATLPEEDNSEKAPFTPEEVAKMIHHPKTTDEWRGLILIAAHTGLRLGDAVSLTRQHIVGDRIVIRPSKTKKSKKMLSIPLSPEVLEWIGKREGKFFPHLSTILITTLSTGFARMLKRYDIPRTVTLPGNIPAKRSFHSLRHSFTSWLADADVHADVRQKLTGHASAGMHAIYSHHDKALKKAVKKLPKLSKEKS